MYILGHMRVVIKYGSTSKGTKKTNDIQFRGIYEITEPCSIIMDKQSRGIPGAFAHNENLVRTTQLCCYGSFDKKSVIQ